MTRNLEPGERFGRYTVVGPAERSKYYICKCDCGNIKEVRVYELLNGDSRSCGCLKSELTSKRSKTHGMTKHSIYYVWGDMKSRCNNPHDEGYHNYGGRGIKVCDEWSKDFCSFYKWSMEHGWSENLQIDRIDNNKGYSPDNCRWTDVYTNANNKRNNHFYEFNGESHTLPQWSRILGIKREILKDRLSRGWSIEDAFTKPKMVQRKYYGIDCCGETHILKEWSNIVGISAPTIRMRLESGWEI